MRAAQGCSVPPRSMTESLERMPEMDASGARAAPDSIDVSLGEGGLAGGLGGALSSVLLVLVAEPAPAGAACARA